MDGPEMKKIRMILYTQPYLRCQFEFCIDKGVMCHDWRLVIPKPCPKDTKQCLHFRQRSSKYLAVNHVIDQVWTLMENLISQYAGCQPHQRPKHKTTFSQVRTTMAIAITAKLWSALSTSIEKKYQSAVFRK